MQHITGASHAAAWCATNSAVLTVREDIGRHNALDKLIGAMARTQVDGAKGFICITSRARFERVQKAAMAGVGLLAAVSGRPPRWRSTPHKAAAWRWPASCAATTSSPTPSLNASA